MHYYYCCYYCYCDDDAGVQHNSKLQYINILTAHLSWRIGYEMRESTIVVCACVVGVCVYIYI